MSTMSSGGEFSRRQFLGLGAAVLGGAALAACSSSSGTPTTGSTGLLTNTGRITVLTWETYHDKPWLDQYKSDTGVQVDAIPVGSGDEMFAKVQSGSVKPDLLYFDSGLVPRFVKSGFVAPVDVTLLNNIGNITSGLPWKTNNTFEDQLYGIPYNWGTMPLMYNASAVSPAPTSWGVLWDPAYRGKVVMFDAADMTIPMIAFHVGAQDPYHLTDEEFEKVREALRELRPQVRAVAKGFDDAVNIFASGEGVVGPIQNISIATTLRRDGKNFDYSFPDEGVLSWQDNAFISAEGQRQEVYDFIDANIDVPWQARFIEASTNNGILSASEAKAAKIPTDILEATNILEQDDPGFWAKMRPMEDPESISKRLEVWNEFLAGG